jgi:hypothetical protein
MVSYYLCYWATHHCQQNVYLGVTVKCLIFLSSFKQTWISLTDFIESLHKFYWTYLVEGRLIHVDRQARHDTASMCFLWLWMCLKRRDKNKTTSPVFYASIFALINNCHMKEVARIWKGYVATGENKEMKSIVCTVPLLQSLSLKLPWTVHIACFRGTNYFVALSNMGFLETISVPVSIVDKTVQKMGRVCIQSGSKYRILTRKSSVRPRVRAQLQVGKQFKMIVRQILRIWNELT